MKESSYNEKCMYYIYIYIFGEAFFSIALFHVFIYFALTGSHCIGN